jgi:hypothetical protein
MSKVKERLAAAISEADAQSQSRLRTDREGSAEAAAAFKPVREAASELRDELRSIADINFAINPDSVCITLIDRELWFGYDTGSQHFAGEESAHSWYGGERYATQFAWADAEACIEAMIRSCAQYFRMARAVNAAFKPD